MKNRKLLLIVSLVLALTMSLGGTLAYLTDTEEAVNVMTLGNVDIEQTETDAEGNAFEQSQPLYPAYDNGTEMVGTIVKKVSVENTGSSDAYVRTWMAFEAGNITDLNTFKALINIDFAVENVEWLDGVYEIDGQKYFIANVLYTEAVKPGDTVNSLESFYMASSAGNDDVAQFGNTYEVLVLSQAVQTNNMPGAAEAMEAAFPGMVHPWEGKDIAELPTTVVRTAADLKAAIEKGGNVLVAANIELESAITIPEGKTVILNLNGKNLSSSDYVFENYGDLTIMGEGQLGGLGGIRSHSGSVTINGGTFTGSSDWNKGTYQHILKAVNTNVVINDGNFDATIKGMTNAMINVSENSVVTINGGKFKNVAGELGQFDPYMFTYEKNGKLIINGGDFHGGWRFNGETTTTDIYGGNFEVSYDGQSFHANSTHVLTVYGGAFSGKLGDRIAQHVADGYIATNSNGTCTVAPILPTVVNKADDLIEALEAGEDVKLMGSIKIDPANMSNAYGTTGINIKNGQTIDGNGYILDIKGAGGTWDSGINTTGGLIKNITVTGSFRGIFINHNSTHSEPVVLENVTIEGTTYTISCDQGMNQGLTATDSTFNGWTSYAATLGDAKFVDCSFGEGNGYAYCRPYAPTEFVDCEFEAGYEMDARAAVTFENCTIGGEKLTAENLATLVTSNIANATVK